MIQSVYENVSTTYSSNNQAAYAMMSKPRIKTPTDDNPEKDILDKYQVLDVNTSNVANNPRVLKLNSLVNDPHIKAAITAKRFEIAHGKKYDFIVNIPFESGTEAVPVKTNGEVMDMPLVSSELVWLLSNCLAEETTKDMDISFKSGLRANDRDGKWKSTGYMMILEIKKQGDVDKFAGLLDKYVDNTNIIKDGDGVFKYKKDGKKFTIMALAPKNAN